jgi:hypothetical protein
MNIQRWKGTLWLASLAAGASLGYLVYSFLKNNAELAKEVSDELISRELDSVKKPEEQKADAVDYKDVKLVFHEYDWTGKEKPKAVVATPGEPPKPTYTPVKDLLKVLALKVDTTRPDHSRAYVSFLGALASFNTDKEATILKIGESLPRPHHGVSVADITPAGVVFAFEDQARAKETLTTSRAQNQIVVVGPGGVITPQAPSQIAAAPSDLPPYRPEQTVQIKKNEFQIGTQTLVDLEQDYSRILSQDLSYSTYRDPKTGKNEGIKINRVAPGSIPAQAGMTEGEVLKSINGHRVTSVNDAIAFVKANADSTDVWEAVFEKQGREFTRTYHSPPR